MLYMPICLSVTRNQEYTLVVIFCCCRRRTQFYLSNFFKADDGKVLGLGLGLGLGLVK